MTDALFWDCGTQFDLADLDGKLYVPAAYTIRPRLQRLAQFARRAGIPRLCTVVTHREGDPDITTGKPDYKTTYPPHCLENTDGWRQIPETACERPVEIPREPHAARPVRESLKAYHLEVLVEVPGFDPWPHPALATFFEVLAPKRVVLYGLPADKTLAAAANGLCERGVPVTLFEDALRPFDGKAWEQLKAGWADTSFITWAKHTDLLK